MDRLHGVVVAALTPMSKSGDKVDLGAVKGYVDFLVEKGVDALFVNGTTGEGLLMTIEERKKVLEAFITAAGERISIVAHCGATRLDEVTALLEHAQSVGVNGVGVVTPFYYRFRENEIEEFYSTLAKNLRVPMYLYNIPSLTNNKISVQMATRLHEKYPLIVGVKDSSGDFSNVLSLINDTPQDFDVLTGYDRAFLSVLFVGGKGCVSGPAAVFPEFFVNLKKAYDKGEYEKALEIQKKLTKVSLALADGSNIPLLKSALKWRGINIGNVRSPLKALNKEKEKTYRNNLEEILEEVGLSMKA